MVAGVQLKETLYKKADGEGIARVSVPSLARWATGVAAWEGGEGLHGVAASWEDRVNLIVPTLQRGPNMPGAFNFFPRRSASTAPSGAMPSRPSQVCWGACIDAHFPVWLHASQFSTKTNGTAPQSQHTPSPSSHDPRTVHEMGLCLRDAQDDPAVGVIILTGGNRAAAGTLYPFCLCVGWLGDAEVI